MGHTRLWTATGYGTRKSTETEDVFQSCEVWWLSDIHDLLTSSGIAEIVPCLPK